MVKLLAAAAVTLSLFSATTNARCERGMAWATDNRYAKAINNLPRVTWLHHWENGHVEYASSKIQQIMMYWGPKKKGKWEDVKKWLKKHDPNPKYIFGFNEPDVGGQSNMKDASKAATIYMNEIYKKFHSKGTKLGSPAIVWDIKWLKSFRKALVKQGGDFDFVCIHWYGSWKDLAGFKKYVKDAHESCGSEKKKDVWILEMGITTGSKPTQKKIKKFMMEALTWLDTQPYVKRVAWHGGYESNHPPDNYASNMNALFKPGGKLSDLGMWYGYSSKPNKRSHHLHRSEFSNETITDADDEEDDAVHCDEMCELRKQPIDLTDDE